MQFKNVNYCNKITFKKMSLQHEHCIDIRILICCAVIATLLFTKSLSMQRPGQCYDKNKIMIWSLWLFYLIGRHTVSWFRYFFLFNNKYWPFTPPSASGQSPTLSECLGFNKSFWSVIFQKTNKQKQTNKQTKDSP